MRPIASSSSPDDHPPGGGSRPSTTYVMSAAAVVFSFGGLRERLGQPLSFLHAPVPGYESDLSSLVDRALGGLREDRPLWRNNW